MMNPDNDGRVHDTPIIGRGEYTGIENEGPRPLVVECLIQSISLLLPFDVNASVGEIADRAYEEYNKLNPRAPPMKVLCVRDASERILSKSLRIQDHNLGATNPYFDIQMEEYTAADHITQTGILIGEYRKWQLWCGQQIYDTIKDKIHSQFSLASLESVRESQEQDNSSNHDDIDTPLLDLLYELSFSPDESVKCMIVETLSLLRLQSSSISIVSAASRRLCKFIQEEIDSVKVVAYAMFAFRANAKGLLPLSSFHGQEVAVLHSFFRREGEFTLVLARFRKPEQQRQLMVAYKAMYVHNYDLHVDEYKSAENGFEDTDMKIATKSTKAISKLIQVSEKEIERLHHMESVEQPGRNIVPSYSFFQQTDVVPNISSGIAKKDIDTNIEQNVYGNDVAGINDTKNPNAYGSLALSFGDDVAGMNISRIISLLCAEERSVWSFAVRKLHLILQKSYLTHVQDIMTRREEVRMDRKRMKLEELEEAREKAKKGTTFIGFNKASNEVAQSEQDDKNSIVEDHKEQSGLTPRQVQRKEDYNESDIEKERIVWEKKVTEIEKDISEEHYMGYSNNGIDFGEDEYLGCDYRHLFCAAGGVFSTSELAQLITALFDRLKDSIDTRTATIHENKVNSSDNKANKIKYKTPGAKELIESALTSPNTDLLCVRRIIDCLYRLAGPISIVPTNEVDDCPVRNTFNHELQVGLAKIAVLRARLLLTLCHAENHVLAGKCALLLNLAVRYNAGQKSDTSTNSDSITREVTASLDDGWSDLGLRLDPIAVIDFLLARNKAFSIDLQNQDNSPRSNKAKLHNQNLFDAINIEPDGRKSTKSSIKPPDMSEIINNEEEIERDIHSKHLVCLALDYIYSLTQMHSTSIAFGTSSQVQKNRDEVIKQTSTTQNLIKTSPSGQLETLLAQANEVTKYASLELGPKNGNHDDIIHNKEIYSNGEENYKRMTEKDKLVSTLLPKKPTGFASGVARSNTARLIKMKADAKESERILESVFSKDSYKYLVRIWHLANFIPSSKPNINNSKNNIRQADDPTGSERFWNYCLSLQQRRLAMECISHLSALSNDFRDQLLRINAIPKLITLAADPGIVILSGKGDVNYRTKYAKTFLEAQLERYQEGNVDFDTPKVGKGLFSLSHNCAFDLSLVRSILRLMLNLVVLQHPNKQSTIVRLLEEIPIGGEINNIELKEIAQNDETCAFYYAALMSFK